MAASQRKEVQKSGGVCALKKMEKVMFWWCLCSEKRCLPIEVSIDFFKKQSFAQTHSSSVSLKSFCAIKKLNYFLQQLQMQNFDTLSYCNNLSDLNSLTNWILNKKINNLIYILI
jgi:hypothetical protein